MSAIFFLSVFSGVAFAASSLACTIFYFCEGQWPIWHFRLFFAWWWPFRKASAATIIADTMVSSLYKDWSEVGYKGWTNPKLRAKVSDWLDTVKLEIDGDKVPLSQWDRYRIADAINRLRKGNVGDAKESAACKAAEAVIKAYGERP